MAKGPKLSTCEKAQVAALHASGVSNRKIAAQLRWSFNGINCYLKDTEAYKQTAGRPRKLSAREERLLRTASNSTPSAENFRRHLDLLCRNERYYEA
ncbi:unnamed protein product [Heligmosomoides polygyrus]|uniref:HTH_Tnp_Tc3_1 domain-containing protein n=1 Tax=Heligmosomoides polygyrus TaxID=6339 RepID=A0A183FAY0_HELPZ|nr:unnamed protein product [Heligmosomoides polygyrus]